jgi:hypothetical protein
MTALSPGMEVHNQEHLRRIGLAEEASAGMVPRLAEQRANRYPIR